MAWIRLCIWFSVVLKNSTQFPIKTNNIFTKNARNLERAGVNGVKHLEIHTEDVRDNNLKEVQLPSVQHFRVPWHGWLYTWVGNCLDFFTIPIPSRLLLLNPTLYSLYLLYCAFIQIQKLYSNCCTVQLDENTHLYKESNCTVRLHI